MPASAKPTNETPLPLRTVIIGTGSSIPPLAIPNEAFLENTFFEDFDQPFPPDAAPKIVAKLREITDIAERRYAGGTQVASDLALEAASRALASAGIDPETLDYLILAHNLGDVQAGSPRSDLVPSLAARVKQQLRIANPACVCYDIAFGCPGWLQAVIQADYFLRSGDAKRALVIGAETLSRMSDPSDRDSMIYADGAGAVVLEARPSAEPIGILAHAVRSDTLEHARLLWMDRPYDPAVRFSQRLDRLGPGADALPELGHAGGVDRAAAVGGIGTDRRRLAAGQDQQHGRQPWGYPWDSKMPWAHGASGGCTRSLTCLDGPGGGAASPLLPAGGAGLHPGRRPAR